MAKVNMNKVSIYALKSERKKLVEDLQGLGVIDIKLPENAKCAEGFSRPDMESVAVTFERNVAACEQALGILNEYAPENKGMLASLSGRREITADEFLSSPECSGDALAESYAIMDLSRRIVESNSEIVRRRTALAQLEPWESLDVPLRLSSTKKTAVFIGALPKEYSTEQLREALNRKNSELVYSLEIISSKSEQTCIFAACLKEQSDLFEQVLRELGFVRPPQATSKIPSEKIKHHNAEIINANGRIEACRTEICEKSDKRREIESAVDYYTVRAEKYRAIGGFDHSKNTFIVKGYVAATQCEALKEYIEHKFIALVESEKADEEEAPALIKNNAFVKPAESITRMYALPLKGDIDPTPIMCFFYYFFFGMMLSDIGYGLLLALGSWLLIKKLNPESAMKNNLKLFLYCGISTCIWGVLFGSFFGDAIPIISEVWVGFPIKIPPLLFDPMEKAVSLLILSLCLGFIQIMVGMGAKFYISWKNGDKAGAIFDTGLWMLLLAGLALLAASMTVVPTLKTVGIAVPLAAAIGIILTGGREKKGIMKFFSGLAGLYNITGYVSDLMSYSRLMALGLTTAAMSSVFNMLSTMGGKSVAGVLVFLIVFPITHGINFALNALGAYVHTVRLQYVELFSKFYEGGQREFEPFSFHSKYTRIKEEKRK